MRAAIKFGGQVDALARHYGIGGAHPGAVLLKKVEKGESGGRGNAVSSAGARGWTQFMPATRAEYVKKYGIDPWRSESEALHATAIYLSHDARGLAGYNPGDPSYTKYILGQHAAIKGGGASPTTGGSSTVSHTTPAATHLQVNQAILDTLSRPHKPGTLAKAVLDKLAYAPQYTTHTAAKTTTTKVSDATGSSVAAAPTGGHVAHVDGKPVAAWIANILQQAKATGLWNGTVQSGVRTDAEQKVIYKSGTRPAAVPRSLGGKGSNHEFTAFPGGAVDVSDPAGLNRALKHLGITKLQWAGPKDEPHFSHPHNGGY